MLGRKGSQTTSDNRHCPEFCSGRIDRIWSGGGLFADHPVFPIPVLEVMLRARYGDLHGSLAKLSFSNWGRRRKLRLERLGLQEPKTSVPGAVQRGLPTRGVLLQQK